MKKIINILFRHKMILIFVMIGQFAIYISVFGILNTLNIAELKEKDRIESVYKSRMKMEIIKSFDSSLISEDLKNIDKANIIITKGLAVNYKEVNWLHIADLIIALNEELPYKLIEGHIPGTDPDDKGKNLVAIGRDKCKYTYEENGKKYITLDNEKYEVCGILGSKYSDFWDYKIILNVNNIGDNVISRINDLTYFNIEILSNEINVSDIYEDVYVAIKTCNNDAAIDSYQLYGRGESEIRNTLARNNINKKICILLFSLCNCIVISEFYFLDYKKEIVIYKILGAKNSFIIKRLMISFVVISGFTLILYGLVATLLNTIGMNGLMYFSVNAKNIISMFIVILLVTALSMIYPYIKMTKLNITSMRLKE